MAQSNYYLLSIEGRKPPPSPYVALPPTEEFCPLSKSPFWPEYHAEIAGKSRELKISKILSGVSPDPPKSAYFASLSFLHMT